MKKFYANNGNSTGCPYFAAMLYKGIYTGILLIVSQLVLAQTTLGSWTNLNVKKTVNEKWSAYVEFQARSLSLYDRFYYYELKGGATYALNKNYSFTLGTGLYNTFNEGPDFDDYSKQKEIRVWEQFNMEHVLSVLAIEHRYRIEQRFTDKFANRIRYRLNVNLPLNSRKMDPGTVYLSSYNELFFTDKVPHFSRNRFLAGGGYIFNNKLKAQAGWLRQVDFLEDKERRKGYLFMSVGWEL